MIYLNISAAFTVFTLVYVEIIPFHVELLYASVIIGENFCQEFGFRFQFNKLNNQYLM